MYSTPLSPPPTTEYPWRSRALFLMQFKNNTQGTMSVYVFDSASGSVNVTGGDYLANACRFAFRL